MQEDNATNWPDIGEGWREAIAPELEADFFVGMRDFLATERHLHTVYPPPSRIFAAFGTTPFAAVRAVILGQDPYHGPGQANGLCFSVAPGIPAPPSLQNIFAELQRDLGIPRPGCGDLTGWAEQGVLLLNATLTVRANEAGSHQRRGWERLTDAAIRALSAHHNGLVFLLWGRHAQLKATLIDRGRHHILTAPHPSPLSAYRGFLGCGHFSRTNALLQAQGKPPIHWSVSCP